MTPEALADRGPQFVSQTEVDRQLPVDFPIVLQIAGPCNFLRRDEVGRGDVTAVELTNQSGSDCVTRLIVGRRKSGLVPAVTDVSMRVRNLEEWELDLAVFGTELQRMLATSDGNILQNVEDVVVFLRGNPIVRASLLIAANADLGQASVVRGGCGRVVPANTELSEQILVRIRAEAGSN